MTGFAPPLALLASAILVAEIARGAEADAQPVVVEIDAASEGLDDTCVGRDELVRSTEASIGRNVFGPPETADVRVTLRVESPRRATIELADRQGRSLGRRALQASSCDELTSALVLALSLMLDFSTEEVSELREGNPPPPPPPPEPRPPPVPPEPDNERPWALAALSGGRLNLGLAPEASLGVAMGLGLRSDLAFVAVDVGYWFAHEVERSGGQTAVRAWETGMLACPFGLDLAGGDARACARAVLGRVSLRGRGFPQAAHGASWIARAGLGLAWSRDLGPIDLVVEAEATTPLAGYRAVVIRDGNRTESFGSSMLVGGFGVGVGVPIR